jgi:hypothetical protein
VRIGVPWEAVERYTGLYDKEFLDNMEGIIN